MRQRVAWVLLCAWSVPCVLLPAHAAQDQPALADLSPTATASESVATLAEPSIRVGRVTGSRVNVRAGDNLNFEIITRVYEGAQVLVLEERGKWFAITPPPDANCYVSAKYVARSGDAAGRIRGHRVNMRSGPARKFNPLGQLAKDTDIVIVGEQEGWFRIVPPAAARGWISSAYIAIDETATPDKVHELYASRVQELITERHALVAERVGATVTARGPKVIPPTREDTLIPPTGAGVVARLSPERQAPLLTGRLMRSSGSWFRRATRYKIVSNGQDVAYVHSTSLRLNKYVNTHVDVWGEAQRSIKSTPVIRVTRIERSSIDSPASE